MKSGRYLFIGILSLFISACNAQNDWVVTKGNGFSFEIPKNWTIKTDLNGIIRLTDLKYEGDVWAFWVDNLQAISENFIKATVVKIRPVSGLLNITAINENYYRINAELSNGNLLLFLLKAKVLGKGYIIQCFGMQFPEKDFIKIKSVMTRIFESFTMLADNKNNFDKSVTSYKLFRDPNESAFSAQVPANFTSEGGMYRASAVDLRPELHVTSPLKDIYIFIGDRIIPSFLVPNQLTNIAGMSEGTWYNTAAANSLLLRYLPGTDFIRYYLSSKGIRNIKEIRSQKYPELQNTLNNALYQLRKTGMRLKYDGGDLEFSYLQNDKEYKGYMFVTTLFTGSSYNDMNMWYVTFCSGYSVIPDKEDEAKKIMERIVSTFEMDQAWQQRQSNTAMDVSKITTQLNKDISKIINDNFANKQAVSDKINRQFSNYIRGVEDVKDLQTGEIFQVKSGSNYYWMNAARQYIGTDIYDNPDKFRFHETIVLK